jgi:NADH:ubiquinone oxidoreductase subunit 3 (subunit A)
VASAEPVIAANWPIHYVERKIMGSKIVGVVSVIIFCSFCILVYVYVVKKPTSLDQNAGENIQLRQRLDEKNSIIATLTQEVSELNEQNKRLGMKVASVDSGIYLDEAQQEVNDEREATLDAREKHLIERAKTVETQLTQRRAEMDAQMREREESINKREVSIADKEKGFYDESNETMEEIGESRAIKEQYENMRSERDAANATSEYWLAFIWYVTIALGVVILACIGLVFATISKHVSVRHETEKRRQELENRREVAELLSAAIESELPPEQGRMVDEAMKQLMRVEGPQLTQDPA